VAGPDLETSLEEYTSTFGPRLDPHQPQALQLSTL